MYLLTRVIAVKVPEEMRKESLDGYRMGELRHLKEWIYRQRVKAREERGREERRRAREEAAARESKQMALDL